MQGMQSIGEILQEMDLTRKQKPSVGDFLGDLPNIPADSFTRAAQCKGRFYGHVVQQDSLIIEIRFTPADAVEGYSECLFTFNNLHVATQVMGMLTVLSELANNSRGDGNVQ